MNRHPLRPASVYRTLSESEIDKRVWSRMYKYCASADEVAWMGVGDGISVEDWIPLAKARARWSVFSRLAESMLRLFLFQGAL